MPQSERIWQAGVLDRRIKILTPKYKRDPNGEIYEDGHNETLVWAKRSDIDNFDNKEVENAHQVIATGRTDYTIRYKDWIHERCEIVDGSQVFEVLSISLVGRNEAQVIRTRRKDNKRPPR